MRIYLLLVEWLMLMMQMGDSPIAADIDIRDKNAVNILTVHSSKGLEFKVVFLVNLVSDRFPSRERSEKFLFPKVLLKKRQRKIGIFIWEEERRLFYVGMTRAQDILYFTYSDYYGTGKRPRKLSPFVWEALPNLKAEKEKKALTQQLYLTEVLSVYEENGEEEEKNRLLN